MNSGSQYVVAAYAVVLAALLLYVVVVGMRMARLAREAELLARLVEEEREVEPGTDGAAPDGAPRRAPVTVPGEPS